MGTTRYTAEDRAGNRWGVHDHEGWVGKVLDDGSIVGGGLVSDVNRRTVAWRAACSCGWLSDTVLPRPEGADAWPEWEEVPALDVEWIAHTDPYLEALARAHGVLSETEPAVAGEVPAAPVLVDEDFAPVRRNISATRPGVGVSRSPRAPRACPPSPSAFAERSGVARSATTTPTRFPAGPATTFRPTWMAPRDCGSRGCWRCGQPAPVRPQRTA